MSDDLVEQYQWLQSRRRFLNWAGMGLGATVLSSLVAKQANATLPELPHFRPRANRVIFLFMGGAPSQIDLYDYKPGLEQKYKQPLPDEVRDGQRVTAMTEGKEHLIQPSIFKFAQQGNCGRYMSELLPHLSTVADELCFIKSMRTEAINHDEGKTQICTGSQIQGKPSLGAWLSYVSASTPARFARVLPGPEDPQDTI